MRLLIAAAAAMLAATPAFATDWVHAVTAENNAHALFVDRDRIETKDGMIRVWVFYAFAREMRPGVAAIESQQEFDCANRRARRLYVRAYDANGQPGVEGELVTDWKTNEPGDVGDSLLDFVCSDAIRGKPGLGSAVPLAYARRSLLN